MKVLDTIEMPTASGDIAVSSNHSDLKLCGHGLSERLSSGNATAQLYDPQNSIYSS